MTDIVAMIACAIAIGFGLGLLVAKRPNVLVLPDHEAMAKERASFHKSVMDSTESERRTAQAGVRLWAALKGVCPEEAMFEYERMSDTVKEWWSA